MSIYGTAESDLSKGYILFINIAQKQLIFGNNPHLNVVLLHVCVCVCVGSVRKRINRPNCGQRPADDSICYCQLGQHLHFKCLARAQHTEAAAAAAWPEPSLAACLPACHLSPRKGNVNKCLEAGCKPDRLCLPLTLNVAAARCCIDCQTVCNICLALGVPLKTRYVKCCWRKSPASVLACATRTQCSICSSCSSISSCYFNLAADGCRLIGCGCCHECTSVPSCVCVCIWVHICVCVCVCALGVHSKTVVRFARAVTT